MEMRAGEAEQFPRLDQHGLARLFGPGRFRQQRIVASGGAQGIYIPVGAAVGNRPVEVILPFMARNRRAHDRVPIEALRRGCRDCHEMSCSVMRCHVSPPPRPSSAGLAEAPPVPILHVVPPSASVPFAPPPACLRRVPSFARIACARAPAFAPARFARLIARTWTNAGHTSPVRSVGLFRTGARQETKRPPDAASSCLILPRFYRGQALTENYFIIHEQSSASSRRPRDMSCSVMRCHVPPPPPAGALSQCQPTTLSPMSSPCLRELPDMSLLSKTGGIIRPDFHRGTRLDGKHRRPPVHLGHQV